MNLYRIKFKINLNPGAAGTIIFFRSPYTFQNGWVKDNDFEMYRQAVERKQAHSEMLKSVRTRE